MDEALAFYGQWKWRRWRWKTHIAQQRTFDQICKKIHGDGDPNKTVIAYGNGSFDHASRGRPAGPTKRIFRELRARFGGRVRKIDEYLTSQFCSKCHQRFTLDHPSWFVKTCKNVDCLVRALPIDRLADFLVDDLGP
jgi:hypothetical protein